ncbi:hypothetical protein PROFUN_13971 [Planoprotostelium fungivorum]|uniref:Ubiquitin-like domain-containing protein n=1 Tax=Planoprotostelium fungivorum TaxID=1890364 RepID=A0A2P6N2N1_9EUKA|nr:hypothetical protein PROFUN_13971 [Planoprotostelium fungivorum]
MSQSSDRSTYLFFASRIHDDNTCKMMVNVKTTILEVDSNTLPHVVQFMIESQPKDTVDDVQKQILSTHTAHFHGLPQVLSFTFDGQELESAGILTEDYHVKEGDTLELKVRLNR